MKIIVPKLFIILNLFCLMSLQSSAQENPLNILLITADDLNWNSVGVYGSPVDDITPNIDQLAAQGIRFNNAHVTIAVCMPSRGVLATGLYPHQSGVTGFVASTKDNPSIITLLNDANYYTAVLAKDWHSSPKVNSPWDYRRDFEDEGMGLGRDANTDIRQADLGENIVLVMGAEGKGIRKGTADHCDGLVKLPIKRTVESLNVSNAAAVALYVFST